MNEDEWPHIEQIDGEHTDMLIEELLQAVQSADYSHPNFDGHFTSIVRRYIHEGCPDLMVSRSAGDRLTMGPVHYLTMLCLDFQVIAKDGPNWPAGGFENCAGATCAVSVFHDDGDTITGWWPGSNINQAALGAILQYAREVAHEHYNQPDLFEGRGGGYAH